MKAALLILCFVLCVLAIYSSKYPREVIIINKSKTEGHTFRDDNGALYVMYPTYEITVMNGLRVRTINVDKSVWEGVSKWQKFNTKHPLKMYGK